MNPSPVSIKPTSSTQCQCRLCLRGRRFWRNTAKLRKTERDWMRGFYDYVFEAEAEVEMQRAWEHDETRRKRKKP